MPLLDTPGASTALDYWRRSQHIQALKPVDREAFVTLVVTPDLNRTTDPFRRRLLGALVDRVNVPAAAG